MSGQVVCAHGVGGLKATCYALAVNDALLQAGVPVLYRSGASGGSLATAALSGSAAQAKGAEWVAERITKIKEDKLLDDDALQQALDAVRKRVLGRRKGDLPMLAWYRGNGLLEAIRAFVADFGTVVNPFEIVSVAISEEVDPNLIPMAAATCGQPEAENYGLKIVRRFTSDRNTTDSRELLAKALRASCGIPFVLRPFQVNEAYEVDGGLLSLTTEEVAADWIAANAKPSQRLALVITDMRSVPTGKVGRPDDVFEMGVQLVRTVGTAIQHLNATYAMNKLAPLEVAIMRFTPPLTEIRCRQFETAAALKLYREYRRHVAVDDRLASLLNWLKG